LLVGCQSLPNYPNLPLAAGVANSRVTPALPNDPDEPINLIAFFGGGSRAAALGLSILDQLNALSYAHDGYSVRLTDRVRVISSVSGGSVIAAWYGLVGASGMDELNDRFLVQDNMGSLISTAADPITWMRLIFSRYSRIEALQALLDTRLFAGKTFASLDRPDAPLVILNATDMGSGEVFSFTPDRFNDICSELRGLPVSVGVAASAAFPVALSPMNLRDYSGPTCVGAVPPAPWITQDLTKLAPRYIDVEEFKRARYANALRHGPDAFRQVDYLHLLDGGLADNQGAHALGEAITSPHGPYNLLYAINSGHARRIVVISVNARSDADNGIAKDPAVPGLFSVIGAVTGVPIDSTTAYSNASLQLLVDTLNQAGADAERVAAGDPLFKGLSVYPISIDFDQLHPGQNDLRDRVKAIGTSWNLSADDRRITEAVGTLLLRQHPCFQRLLLDLRIQADFLDPQTEQLCPLPANQEARR